MKKLISMILAVLYFLFGCNDATVDNNNSNNVSNDISSEESVESVESTESSVVSSESGEAVDGSEESSESVSSETSSEESSEDKSSEESREEEPSSQPDISEEDNGDNDSSAPVTPPVGNDNGNESKPEEDVSSPVESEPEKDESKVEDVSSVPDVSEPDVSEPDVPVAHVHSYTSLVYEPWCGEEGYTEYTCECGHTYKADYTAALTHDYGEWKVVENPSTTKEGKQRRLCKICNKFEYESIPKIVITITQEDLDYMAEVGLEYLNSRRAEKGLQPLVTGPIAHQMASERAEELVTDFSHNGCNSIYREYMYNPNDSWGSPEEGGENIARSSSFNEDLFVNKEYDLRIEARGMISGFETSPGHWGDLMDDRYTACGIGFYIEQVSMGKFNVFVCVMTMDKLYGTDAQ